MKTFILSIIVTMITSVAGAQQKSFYDFTVKTIDGRTCHFPRSRVRKYW